MPKAIQLEIGRVYGRLTVLQELDRVAGSRVIKCRCSCGKVKPICFKMLRKGAAKSCGCLRSEMVAAKNFKHGASKAELPEYGIWKQMRNRCNTVEKYEGVTVCKRWDSFENFLEDMGPRTSNKHSIDRKEVTEGYSPWNCHWATASQQARNKHATVRLEYEGNLMPLADIADLTGVSYSILYRRTQSMGWSLEKALRVPSRLGTNQYSKECVK